MKMKKIISLCVCAVMALSTVANAAYITESDGTIHADKVTSADVSKRTPTVDTKVTQLTATEAAAEGLALGRGSSALNDTNSNFVKFDLTVTGVGDLLYAFQKGTDYGTEMQVRLFQLSVVYKGVNFKKAYTKSTLGDITWTTNDPADNEDKQLVLKWFAGADQTAFYPKAVSDSVGLVGTYIEEQPITATYVVAFNKTDEFKNLTPAVTAFYNLVNDEESAEPKGYGAGNVISIPPVNDPVLDKVVISGATSTTLTVGDEVTLTAKAYNDDETENAATIAWTVEGDAVTVKDGLVKAVKEGTATVTATAEDGEITKSASVTFTVETEKLPALPEVTVAGGDVAGQEVKSGENTIGYLWKAIFNAATIKDKYIATFKSGAETNAATLKGFAAQNIEGEGNVSVIVALNTAKAAVTLGITDIAE